MKEKDLRKWHRNFGIILAFFVILQAGSGLLITLEEMTVPHTHAGKVETAAVVSSGQPWPLAFQAILSLIHHGGGTPGILYRIFLGLGMAGMALSGSFIYFKVRARNRAFQKRSRL